jgi:8-oxo-dGTP pyrophosphatase MutT (NUDIX family)
MQPAMSTSASSGFPAGARQADDMTPEGWAGLIGGLMEFLGEEVKEPEHAADAQPHGAGVAFVTPEGHALFLKRSAAGDHPNEFCFPGGGVEPGENAVEAARREGAEETGHPTDGELQPIDRRSTAGVDFMTFAHPVDEKFEPKLNGEHTEHVWAPLDSPPSPLHPGVEATLKGADDSMPVKGGKQSPFDPGTDPEVSLDDEYRRDAKGEFASAGEESGSGTSRREREDGEGRGRRLDKGREGGSGWSEQDLADYADEKPEDVAAADAAKEAEHTATIKFNGDFDMAGLLKHLHHLGAIGASRAVDAIDADDKPVHFGWDGDGADKIVEAQIDGKDVLAGDEAIDGIEVDATHDGPWMSCMSKDRRRMYRNKNVPAQADVDGKSVPVDPILARHEKAEVVELERLLAEFKEKNGREPDEEERKALYLKAHKAKGTPAERDFVEQTYGPGFWTKWSAWCRGEEAKVEKMPVTNAPADADVKPIPHGHGDLEAEDAAWDAAIDIATDWALRMALDRESVRSIDHDGRLHIEVANICKANVCPYKGDEIPGWEELGLDPDKIYRLLRDPEELEKALPSANSLQILKRHVPVNADDHQPWETVGATGSTATWVAPCIQNSLVIWAQDAIDDIESDAKRELSPGYHYRPDMTPGSYQGEAHDGVMREIKFNHLALVETGRQGDDVVIGDTDEVLWAIAERAITEFLQDV